MSLLQPPVFLIDAVQPGISSVETIELVMHTSLELVLLVAGMNVRIVTDATDEPSGRIPAAHSATVRWLPAASTLSTSVLKVCPGATRNDGEAGAASFGAIGLAVSFAHAASMAIAARLERRTRVLRMFYREKVSSMNALRCVD